MAAISSEMLDAPGTAILLHGLGRTRHSMVKLGNALAAKGYAVQNIGYPSRTACIQKLADDTVAKAVAECRQSGAMKIDFVTHSLGGILVRSYLSRHPLPSLGRVVMLAPPNQGSEIVDKLGRWFVFKLITGPAGRELGTDSDSIPNKLNNIGAVNYPVGVIAGDCSIRWISAFFFPGPDDGLVSIERTKLPGMRDHITVHAMHPFIMRHREVIRQTIHFLRSGAFDHTAAGR